MIIRLTYLSKAAEISGFAPAKTFMGVLAANVSEK
jgi:hypothetical protein